MGDYSIRMKFDIDADDATVRQSLTTTDGIAAWWSDRVDGDPSTDGGDLQVAFPDVPQAFHFRVHLDEGEVRWETLEFPPWWAGTTIRWSVAAGDGNGTTLLFTHEGFEPDADIIPIVTPAWAGIIERLKRFAESGSVDPFARS